ncbi:MAG: serine O-acetyltransferase [Planctomycetaceae bacterium]|nr:serine O-acetyltransferase [Planctomycetaceae bacterium]
MGKTVTGDLGRLTAAILANYQTDARTQRIGHGFQPNRQQIVQIVEDMRRLLFPGFFGERGLTEGNLGSHIEHLVAEIREKLEQEIYACVCTERQCPTCADPETCRNDAEKMAVEFLARVPAIRDMLALDAQAAWDGDPAAKGTDEVIYCYPGYYAVTVYRIAHELLALGVPLMPRIMSEHAHGATGADIHPGAMIGKSFFIDHATGVVIGETTHIGDNVKIYQGVTLGAKSFPKDERGRIIKGLQRHPTIEDNVTIYPNATILGGETVVGHNVTIGGNVYVTESVPAESLVVQMDSNIRVLSKKNRPGA